MNFLKYPSLTNHYALGKDRRIPYVYDDVWYATEKIHGANISIVTAKGTEGVGLAKRSGFLTLDDKQFGGFKTWVSEQGAELVNSLNKFLDWEGVTQVHAFGEYFGGKVQRMDYELCKQGQVDVKLFNVILEYDGGTIHYVVSRDMMEKYIPAKYLTPVSNKKTLRELVNGHLEVQSIYGGISEGQVYQPTKGYILNDIFRFYGIKHKTKEFAEVTKSTVKVKEKVEYSPEFLALVEDVSRYITDSRLNNVLSHGDLELENKNIGAIMIALKQDIVKEYLAEVVTTHSDTDVLSAVNKHNGAIALLIKEAITKESNEMLGKI